MSYKLQVASLILILGVVLQFVFHEASGFWINFALAALITAAFSVNFLELAVLVLLAIFLLNWQPAFSSEILVLAVLPITVYFIHKFIPFKPWLGNLAGIFFSILIFYLVINPQFLVAAPGIFLYDVLGGFFLGAIAFRGLQAA